MAENGNTIEVKPESVKLISVFKVNSPHGQLNVVKLQYQFPGQNYVISSSHGLLSNTGTLKFLTAEDRFEFFDPDSKIVLAVLKIDASTKLMGRKQANIPLISDFPATSRTAQWNHKQPFGDRMIAVLNHHFPNGYLPIHTDVERIYITNFKVFEQSVNNEKARVAAMIKIPFQNQIDKPTLFRVHFIAQERRSRTDWREAQSDPVISYIQKFISRLTLELSGQGV